MKIDLFVDLNTEDETGMPWTYLDQAGDPSVVVPGRLIVVGAGSAIAIAEVIDAAPDGLVHVRPLPGPVTQQRLTNASQRVRPPSRMALPEIDIARVRRWVGARNGRRPANAVETYPLLGMTRPPPKGGHLLSVGRPSC